MRKTARWGIRIVAVGCLGVVLWLGYLWPRVVGLLSLDQTHHGWTFPSILYSDWLILEKNKPISVEQIERHLKRAGYVLSPKPLPQPGAFFVQMPRLIIHLRAFSIPNRRDSFQKEQFLQIEESQDAIEKLEASADGTHWTETASARLEPAPITRFYDQSFENREFVRPERIPVLMGKAVVAVEDRRFFTHWGWDPRGMGRAALQDLRQGRLSQGGSTLTQQLAKNIFLTRQRTFWRKILEVFASMLIEMRYSKDEILGLYLNQVYLGQDGPVSISGVESASRHYFAKPAADLDLAQCATLAGLIRSPLLYSPTAHPDLCVERRNSVLNKMREQGFITSRQEREAEAEPLELSMPKSRADAASLYFVDHVRALLLERYSASALTSQGLKIFSSLDPFLQEGAEDALKNSTHEVALVALDPQTGMIRAMVGGRNYVKSQFNRATQAKRQPGSTFKPFVYAAALEDKEKGWTLAGLLNDSPIHLRVPGQETLWTPKNYDGTFRGRVTLAQALMHSLNIPTVILTQSISPEKAVALAHRLGIDSDIQAVPSVGLGTSEVTLLELTSAYGVFATSGMRTKPLSIKAIYDHNGNLLEEAEFEPQQVLDAMTAYLINWTLNQAMIQGTAQAAITLGMTGGYAGKTGTTDEGKDAWFIGYSPKIVCGVWIGDDTPRASGLTGPSHALPLWMSFMKRSGLERSAQSFEIPQGIQFKKIDQTSGLLARSGCPDVATMPFAGDTFPTIYCPNHPGGVIGLLRRWFGSTQSIPMRPPSPLVPKLPHKT